MDKAENMSSRCFMSDSLCFFSYVKIVPRALNMKESFVKGGERDLTLPLKRAKLYDLKIRPMRNLVRFLIMLVASAIMSKAER